MFHIRHNIIFSATAHSILLAAALLVGGSSEIRKVSLLTVSLFDEKDNSSPEKQVAVADIKQNAETLVSPKSAVKTASKLSSAQEIISKQNPAPSIPVRPQSETEIDSVPGLTSVETQFTHSQIGRSSPSAVGSQTFRSSSTETGAAAVSRGQTGQATQAGADPSIKQLIRDTLQNNLVYPYIARKRRIEGTVLVDFKINQKGIAENIIVLKGSGYAILDSSAKETVVKASPFPVSNYSVEVPITYRLTQ